MNPNNIFDKYAPQRVSTGTVLYMFIWYIILNVGAAGLGVMLGLSGAPMVGAVAFAVIGINIAIAIMIVITVIVEYGDDIDRWLQRKCNDVEQWIESRYGGDDR